MLIADDLMSACNAALAEREELHATVAMLKSEVVRLRWEIDQLTQERRVFVPPTWRRMPVPVGAGMEQP